ncbi:MAG: metalloregulator ArsR/SmtB family transcription factor [Acidobacteriota bacterium]|nr:metalloregulator ArsR/SmtB family transcription factor [Acidobacteriota bacterium]
MAEPDPRLDRIFFALSDPTRRAIVGRLAGRPSTVGELAQPFSISAPAISKHMKILEGAGLIRRRVEGRRHHCTLDPRALEAAQDWLSYHRDFWEARLDELESFLEESDKSSQQRSETTQRKGSKRMKGTTP